MERNQYLVLVALAVGIVGVGVTTTTRPIGAFLVASAAEAAHTAVAMVWLTWWALVVGFAIAGGVEAWVDSDDVASVLQGSGPSEVAAGAFFGFVSSSCSYSAIATAKNLFKKDASAAAALGAFMFASTNLVIEIGAVIWILLGWQFLAANILGGLLLIVLMAAGFRLLVPDHVVEEARKNVREDETPTARDPVCGMEVRIEEAEHTVEHGGKTYYFCSESCKDGFNPEEDGSGDIIDQATSIDGWRRLADKQWKEWAMLWDEIAIGFVFASLIAGFVPDTVWIGLFGGGGAEMPLYILWTAVLGAIVGVATFVCSVGNVPFGAVLYNNGLPFGSVLSYIYADLIVPPIAQAYREYYGDRFAAILVALIFAASVVSGVVVHFVFLAGGLIPPRGGVTVTEATIEADYKLVLNVATTLLFLGLYALRQTGGHAHEHDETAEP